MIDGTGYSYLLLWLSFAFCLSLTAGGILIIFRARPAGSIAALTYLQYFLILTYVFGYYSLWSRILILHFLDIENIDYLTTINSHLGVPFFAISMIMLLLWAINIQYKLNKIKLIIALIIGVMVIIFVWKWVDAPANAVRASYSALGFLVAVAVASIISSGGNNLSAGKWSTVITSSILLTGLIHLTYFTILSDNQYYEVIFVFLFFLFSTALTVLYIYTTETKQSSESLGDFILRYNITKREADIIQGIYAGKTNQEIADQLFITLQTVKDHSSRIYQKTQLKNRTQLAALLRENQITTSNR